MLAAPLGALEMEVWILIPYALLSRSKLYIYLFGPSHTLSDLSPVGLPLCRQPCPSPVTLLKHRSLHPAKEIGLGGGDVCWVPPRLLSVHFPFELYAKQAILTKLKKMIVVAAVFLIASIISSF